MKKESLFWIGIIIVIISGLNELALSMMKEEQWSNYVQRWDTRWKKEKRGYKNAEP